MESPYNEFELVDRHDYNPYERVGLIFYSKDDENNNKFLLLVNKGSKTICPISTKITREDNSPIITISRHILQHFQDLFTEENLMRIERKEKVKMEKTYCPSYFVGPRVMGNKTFIEYTDKFSNNPIQFDSVKGQILFFFEMKYEFNVDLVNECMNEQQIPFNFCFLTEREIISRNINLNLNEIKITEIETNLLNLIDQIKFLTGDKNEPLTQFIKDSELNESSEVYCLITCLPKNKELYYSLGYFMFRPLFLGKYRKNGEKWIEYRSELNQFPDHETLSKAKAVLLPGSLLHVYNNDEQTVSLVNWLRNSLNTYKTVRFLGICYGHQLITTALNGKVNLRAEKSLFLKVEKVLVRKDFNNFHYVKKSGIDLDSIKTENPEINAFTVMQVHSDEVAIKPERLINYGSSESCTNEITATEDGQILTFQGHPEYTPEFYTFRTCLSNFDYSVQKIKKENMYKQYSDEDIDNYFEESKKEASECESKYVLNDKLAYLCHSFLKNSS